MRDTPTEWHLADPEATERLGAAMARSYRRLGSRLAVVALRGDLGAGKTTWARACLHELGVGGVIRSPTYTLVEMYELPGIKCVHIDLYRLNDPSEVIELGLRDYLDDECLLLIEWPENAGTALPPVDLTLSLTYVGPARRAQLSPGTHLVASGSTTLRVTVA